MASRWHRRVKAERLAGARGQRSSRWRARDAGAPAADDVGPVAHATQVTRLLPEAVDTDIPKDEYPKAALDAGFEGAVELKVVIDASGRVRRASVLKDPGYGLGAAAVKIATKYFRFKPGLRDGKPVATEIPFTVYFELP